MKSGEVDLLEQIAAEAAREESVSDDELLLAQLTMGRLHDKARVALEAEARRDPRLARAMARHRPLGEGARQRIADRLIALTAAGGSPPVRVAPVPRRGRRIGYAVTGVLAMAAGVLLWARPFLGENNGAGQTGTAPGLPAYALTAVGGDSVQRGTPAAPPDPRSPSDLRLRLAPGAPLEIVIRPAATVKGAVEARVFLQQGARWEPVSITPEIAPTGTIRLRGDAGTILGQRRGDWLLVVLVGRPALFAGAGAAEQLAQAPTAIGSGWQRLAVPVTVVGDR